MTDIAALLAAALSDRYTVVRQLGRGGMATVFLAQDLKHDREVAIKVLHPELVAAISSERFHREIRIQARLRHPHVVTLLDSGEADGLLYYVMTYIDGETLRERLLRGKLEIGEALRLWRDVVDGIAYAHRHNVAHRDIKPENVLLSERHALVADFGVAKALGSGEVTGEALTAVGVAIGTPSYMSPEQVSGGGGVDHRSDIYALGVLAYEMLAGRPPFLGKSVQSLFVAQLAEDAQPIEQIRTDTPPALAATIRRCMEKEPAKRWGSADELLATVDSLTTPSAGTPGLLRTLTATRTSRRWLGAGIATALLLLTGVAWSLTTSKARGRWAREVALPQARRQTDARITDSAFVLLSQLRHTLPGDPEVALLLDRNRVYLRATTVPAGVSVSWAAHRGDTSSWTPAGVTPFDSAAVPAPSPATLLLVKLEKPGFATAIMPLNVARPREAGLVLDSASIADTSMVRVPATDVVVADAATGVRTVRMSAFAIDRFEVTNEQFKRFVDERGYDRRELWDALPKDVSLESLVRGFTDRTGRRGPATWVGGSVPPGQERFPVSGVSWYEAVAYAKFAGKQLPTIHQWRAAAGFSGSAWIVPRSNMESTAMKPVGSGLGPFGTYDMAGNAREWCINTQGVRRYILGGSWNDPPWTFADGYSEDPLDRAVTNGFRLVRPLDPDSNAAVLAADTPRGQRDYSKERPVSDAEFRTFLRMYDYDRAPLNARIESADSSDPGFIRQTITFDAVYGSPAERVKAYLLLPRNVAPPFQTVVFLPGGNALLPGRSENLIYSLPFVVAAGRAVMYPVLKNMFERTSDAANFAPGTVHNMSGDLMGPNTYRDQHLMMMKDMRRAVDYLATRPDVDTTKLAFAGYSWGGRMAAIALAVEPRFKASVLYLPGLMTAPRRPEVDEINFLPRVRIPTLMLSGRYDDIFPLDRMVLPYVRMMGTPADQKKHVVYPTQHYLPRDQQIAETLDWLDRYLGPVRR